MYKGNKKTVNEKIISLKKKRARRMTEAPFAPLSESCCMHSHK